MGKQSALPVLMLGSSADCPDIEYATGFRAQDPVVALAHGPARVLVVPDLEYGRAREQGHAGLEVLTPRMLGLGRMAARRQTSWVTRLLRNRGLRTVQVAGTFPIAAARAVERAGARLRLAAGPLFPARACKHACEIGHIAESQQAAVVAMRAAIRLIAESTPRADGWLTWKGRALTAEDVRRRIAEVLLRRDCFCRDTIVAGGTQSAEPHASGHGPLPAGQPIVIDIFPQHLIHGYWGDLTRTVVRGACCARLRGMHRAVHAA